MYTAFSKSSESKEVALSRCIVSESVVFPPALETGANLRSENKLVLWVTNAHSPSSQLASTCHVGRNPRYDLLSIQKHVGVMPHLYFQTGSVSINEEIPARET